MKKEIYTPIIKIAEKLNEHKRTLTSRLERNGYKGVYLGKELCFKLDERAWEILKVPVKHKYKNRVPVQQELPLPTAETKSENRQEAREVEINEKVAVALAVELPDVSVTVKAV